MNLIERITQIADSGQSSLLYTDKDHALNAILNLIYTTNLIETYAFEGEIKVVESGRDCDGVEYDGRVHTIVADFENFEALDDEIGEWADGPYHLAIVPWDTDVRYSSRDLVMEAHEDGHPHSITSRFP